MLGSFVLEYNVETTAHSAKAIFEDRQTEGVHELDGGANLQ